MQNDPKTRTFCPELLPQRSWGWEGGVAPEPQRVLHPPRLKASLNAPRGCCSTPKSMGEAGAGLGGPPGSAFLGRVHPALSRGWGLVAATPKFAGVWPALGVGTSPQSGPRNPKPTAADGVPL